MIEVERITKTYPAPNGNGSRRMVLKEISLSADKGEFITLFGPNGCGKSTLLKVLSGAEPFDTGSVQIDGASPQEANTGLVFQNYSASLYPWLTARENILFAFSLGAHAAQRADGEAKLNHLLSSLNLITELPLDNYMYQLSGGQQQLVSILRTLVYDPALILMDEPFSSLDHTTRIMMQSLLQRVWLETKCTIVFVSHDIEEAIFLGNRLILLSPMPAHPLDELDLRIASQLADGTHIQPAAFTRPRNHELLEQTAFLTSSGIAFVLCAGV